MGFFDLAPLGMLLLVLTCVCIYVTINYTGLLRSSVPSVGGAEAANGALDALDVYDFKVTVNRWGGLVGKTIDEAGLDRLQGVSNVRFANGDAGRPIEYQDVLAAEVTEKGVVSFRNHPGVVFRNQHDLNALGRARHFRHLYEVNIRPESDIAIDGLLEPSELRLHLGACFVAGPKRSIMGKPATELDITAGSVVLVEADERNVATLKAAEWSAAFTLVHRVHRSQPPRHGLAVDYYRNVSTFVSFLVMIGLMAADVVRLDYGGVLLCAFYLFTRALTYEQFVSAFKPAILVTIVGAYAMGVALEKTGVVNRIADGMMSVAEPFGDIGVICAIYVCAVVLSMFINNSATVAILGSMLTTIVEKRPGVPIQGLLWTLTYAAGSCFTTPLGYQTNLMVMGEGKYTFGDFARFGLPIQLLHMIFTVLLVHFMTSALV